MLPQFGRGSARAPALEMRLPGRARDEGRDEDGVEAMHSRQSRRRVRVRGKRATVIQVELGLLMLLRRRSAHIKIRGRAHVHWYQSVIVAEPRCRFPTVRAFLPIFFFWMSGD